MWKFEEEHPFALAYRLVEENKLDPWDVDIAFLARAYMEEIRKRELLDLRVPARALLAASFLLRKQVEILFPQPKAKKERKKLSLQEIVEQFESQEQEAVQEIVQKLEKVKKAIKKISARLPAQSKKKKERRFPIHLSRFEDALEELRALFKEHGVKLSFFDLICGKNPVPYFMALMNLYQEGVVEIHQGKPYEDLWVEIINPSPSAL